MGTGPTHEQLEQRIEPLEQALSARDSSGTAAGDLCEDYLHLAANINDAIFTLDESGCFSYASPAIEKITSFPPAAIVGKDFSFFTHPEDRADVMNRFMHTLNGDSNPIEFRIITADGKTKHIALSVRPVFKDALFSGLSGILSDITQRKRIETELQQYREQLEDLVERRTTELAAINKKLKDEIDERLEIEDALRKSEKKYRDLVENSPDIIARIDINCRFIFINDNIGRYMNVSPDFFIGKTLQETGLEKLHCDYLENKLREVLISGRPCDFQYEYIKTNGEHLYFDWRLIPEVGTDNRIETVLSTSRNISERIRSEQERLLLASVIEKASEGILVTDKTGAILYSNPAYRLITGCRQDGDAAPLQPVFFNTDDPLTLELINNDLLKNEPWSGRINIRNGSGCPCSIEVNITPIRDDGGDPVKYVTVCRDVSNEIELEKKLAQAQKMEAIGTLAGGIAHDFNNILTPIIGYTEICSNMVPGDGKLAEYLEHILKSADRAKDMIKHILTFSRQTEECLEALDIRPVVKESLKLLRATLPSTIEFKQKIEDDCGHVKADPTQIHQIMMNLCTNAYHAMGEKSGVLSVTLSRIAIDQGHAIPNLAIKPGPYVRLTVSDTGTGMPPEIQERIFDPYFTTKEKGKGTGMGLAVVHGIVKKSGGDINVYSEPGKGSTFTIYLPEAKADPVQPKHQTISSYPTGKEHILLVDDETYIVEMLNDMLNYLGYTVTAKNSSKEALNTFCNNMDCYDLVITDMTMPGLTGEDLAREILLVRPDIPIILCTGFSDIMSEDQAKTAGIREYIMKPVVMSDIAATIRRVLDN